MSIKKTGKKTLAILLMSCMIASGVTTGAAAYYEVDEFDPSEHTLGVVGSFTGWGEYSDYVMTDEDGNGVYVAVLDPNKFPYTDYEYQFKIRADESWDYNWGAYEEAYDRTFNSQTNFYCSEMEEPFYVYLDTTGEDVMVWETGWTIDPAEIPGGGEGDPDIHTTEDGFTYKVYDGKEVRILSYSGDKTALIIPDTIDNLPVTSVASRGIANNKNITSVVLPKGMKTLPSRMFSGCEKLQQVTLPEGMTFIGASAFSGCTALSSVTIPDSVETIDEYAFSNCSSLKRIVLPEELTEIDYDVFYGSGLESISIPDNVEYISDEAFADCTSLKSVAVGSMVSSISSSSFSGCTALESFTVAADNGYYAVVDGVLFNKDKTSIILYPYGKTSTSFSIPNTVTAIGSYTFSNTKLASVTIPGSVTEIGYSAFANSALTAVTLPSSVTTLGERAFSGCENLETVKIGKNVAAIPYRCFSGCTSLKEVSLGKNLKNIYAYAFYNCDALTSIAIPEGVTSIGYEAFEDCDGLVSVTFPSTLKTIGSEAFNSCDALESIDLPDSLREVDYDAFAYCQSLKTVKYSVNLQNNSQFEGCEGIEKIILGSKVTSFDASMFYLNENTTIEIAEDNQNLSMEDGILFNKDKTTIIYAFPSKTSKTYTIPSTVTDIGSGAFNNNSVIEELTIPSSVKSIGNNAFQYCNKLKTVHLDAALTSIPDSAFRGCGSLAEITIPETVTNIGDAAFYNCNALKKVVIPDAVISIGEIAFADCYNLNTVVIGKNVTSIGYEAFQYDNSLTTVIIPASVTEIGYDAFYGVRNATFYGESGSYAQKWADNNGCTFVEYSELENFSFIVNAAAAPGDTVVIRGLADGGVGKYVYNFAYKAEGDKDWTLLQKFASTRKASFVAKTAGSYSVRIKVRDDMGTITTKIIDLKVNEALKNTSTISAEKIDSGKKVTLTAQADGGTGFYQYAYSYRLKGTEKWTAISGYTAKSVKTFAPADGVYDVKISVKDNTGKTEEKTFSLNVGNAVQALTNNSTVSAETVAKGTAVTLTAVAEGGTGPYTYALMYKKSGSSTWTKIGEKYGTASTGSFKPGSVGTYDIMINVKDSTGKVVSKTFKLNVTAASQALVNKSTVSATEVKKGTAVTLNAAAEGGTAPYTYALMYKKSSSTTWTKIGTKYGTESTGTFTPSTATTYDIMINVKDSTGTVKSKTFTLTVK